MKIKFNTDDNIPLNKIIYFPIIIRSVTKILKSLAMVHIFVMDVMI